MNTQQLLTAPLLDIIFEGRNKEYGAYCLRKEYHRRLTLSMISTAVTISLIIFLFSFGNEEKLDSGGYIISDTITIQPASHDHLPEPPQPPRPAAPPRINTLKSTSPPKIINADNINPDDRPPENSSLDNAAIDVFNLQGEETESDVAPPPGTLRGVVGNIAVYRAPEDSLFMEVEIESTYPGGPKAWARFLNKTFIYPQHAIYNEIQGMVRVSFIVDQSGTVSDIEAVDGPEELKAEAIRVIRKSGKWNPAIQNGRRVKSYKQQYVNFKLMSE